MSIVTTINILFGIFLICQIIDCLTPKHVEDFQMLMPITYTYMTQPMFTNTVVKNTYYRDAKYHVDIDGLSVESKMKTNF